MAEWTTMDIQQGFNRIGIAVSITFLGLSVICFIIAGMNYLEYLNEIAIEYQRFFGASPEGQNDALLMLDSPEEKMKNWNTFKELRYRSVEQSLALAMMCIGAALIALIFWFLTGRAYVALASRRRQGKAGT